MTTLAVDTPRPVDLGDVNEFPVIASDIIYAGAAVGLVIATGHARPFEFGDLFVGICEKQADNSLGAAAAINVRVNRKTAPILPVTGAVITDVGCAVYAQDDNTFSFVPTAGGFIGFMTRWKASGYGVVQVDIGKNVDPNAGLLATTIADDTTIDAQDTGKCMCIATDAKTITLPAVMGIAFLRIYNTAAYGVIAIIVAPDAADMIEAPDVAVTDADTWTLTKATANRGDYLDLAYGDGDGWAVVGKKGIWALTAV